jgi:hypothetical protein
LKTARSNIAFSTAPSTNIHHYDEPARSIHANKNWAGKPGSAVSKHKAKRLFHRCTAMDIDPAMVEIAEREKQAKEPEESRKRIATLELASNAN